MSVSSNIISFFLLKVNHKDKDKRITRAKNDLQVHQLSGFKLVGRFMQQSKQCYGLYSESVIIYAGEVLHIHCCAVYVINLNFWVTYRDYSNYLQVNPISKIARNTNFSVISTLKKVIASPPSIVILYYAAGK